MILYSVIDPQFVFQGWDDYEPEYKEVQISDSVSMIVEDINEDEAKIVKLISSDPQDFLNQDYAPGSIVKKDVMYKI